MDRIGGESAKRERTISARFRSIHLRPLGDPDIRKPAMPINSFQKSRVCPTTIVIAQIPRCRPSSIAGMPRGESRPCRVPRSGQQERARPSGCDTTRGSNPSRADTPRADAVAVPRWKSR